MWNIIFPKKLFQDFHEFLFSTAPRENGCFLVIKSYEMKRKKIILVIDIIKPNEDSWNKSSEHALEPSSSFINSAVVSADSKDASLIFVHTHPDSLHPPKFSFIDEKSNKLLFTNLSPILSNKPIGSLVVSRRGIYGYVFDKGKILEFSNVMIIGNTFLHKTIIGTKKNYHSIATKFDRQIRAIGHDNQKTLQEMKITIVGTGGTGSPLAVQLARMGVKKLRLIDKDIIDDTNLPRIYGSSEKDIKKFKVDVLARHIKNFSKTTVEKLPFDITTTNLVPDIIDSDVIFACTDNLTSRAILNDIAIQYYIPLIDVGCRINLNSKQTINQVIVKVQLVTPGTACLWCSGTLDGKIILQESLTNQEKIKLAEEGYYEKIENQPSIISVTTMAASLAVNKLLGFLGVFGENNSSRTQIEIKDGFMIDDTPEIKTNCICQKRRGLTNRKII